MPKMKKSIVEAAKILGSAIEHDRAAQGFLKEMASGGDVSRYLQESLTTADMLAAFNVATREQVEEQYPKAERVWQKFAVRDTLPDFKEQRYREFLWDDGLLVDENAGSRIVQGALARIPEGTEYPTFGFSTGERAKQLHKHGARLPFFWEMVINDEWNFISSIPGRMTEFALQTEEVEATVQLADENGPRADVFTDPRTNEPLTLAALKAAKQEVRSRRVNGRAVRVPRFVLIVPPALEDTARELLNITSLIVTDSNGEYTTTTNNGDVELVVSETLVDVDQSANVDTTWYLAPANGRDSARTSISVNFLQRHENPDLRISGDTGSYLGGGNVPGLEGSMLNDDIQYRVRHVVTGAVEHPEALFASDGSGVAS